MTEPAPQPSPTPTQPFLSPSPRSTEDGLNTIAVIGGAVGGVLGAVLIVIMLIVIVVTIVIRKRQRRAPKQDHIYDRVGLPELPPRPQVNVSYNVAPINGIKVDSTAATSASSIQTQPNTAYTSSIQTEPYYY